MVVKKPKILFVYDIPDEDYWKDGVWAAINLLEKDFEIHRYNLSDNKPPKSQMGPPFPDSDWNTQFTIGWGAFGSPVDKWLRHHPFKKGLCIAGNAFPPQNIDTYDVLFYETEWYRPQISSHKNTIRAFGVNTDIFKPNPISPKLFDYLVCGAFANWKRQELINSKFGVRIAIGEVQRDNMVESIKIMGNLIIGGCGVIPAVLPSELVKFYCATKVAYAPMDIYGGGERFVWEAMACGIPVEILADNLKLQELVNSEVKDHHWYAQRLKEGISKIL